MTMIDLTIFKRYFFRFENLFYAVFISILYLFILNNYVGKADTTIVADGVGYYDYLPSAFIHHDLCRYLEDVDADSAVYQRVNGIDVYANWKNAKVNRYPVGVAVLQFPFFFVTNLQHQHDSNLTGYEPFFQKMVFISAIFYLILGLFFLMKVLEIYDVKRVLRFFIGLFALLSTSLSYYAQMESSFSHVYSFFVINAFVYFSLNFFKKSDSKYFLLAAAFLGIIFLIRPVNLLVVFFLPYLAGSLSNLKDSFLKLFQRPFILFLGVFVMGIMMFLQFLLYFLQTGDFLVYSYSGYGFDFLNPHFFDILFSFKKGLFIYTPILIFVFPALIYLIIKRKMELVLLWLFAMGLVTYIFSSWESWFYGCSYGLRVYIDYYLFFFIPIGLWMNKQKIWLQFSSLAVAVFFVYINLVQVYQYQNFILHWDNMDKLSYKKVFLKTDHRFKGLLWKMEIFPEFYQLSKRYETEVLNLPKNSSLELLSISSSEIPNVSTLKFIRLELANNFDVNDPTRFILSVQDADSSSVFWFPFYLIHLSADEFGKKQRGYYNFDLQNIEFEDNFIIKIEVFTGDFPTSLEKIQVDFYTDKFIIQ